MASDTIKYSAKNKRNDEKQRWMSIALWLEDLDEQLKSPYSFYTESQTTLSEPLPMASLDLSETLKPFDLTDLIHYYLTQEFGLNDLSQSFLDKLTRAVLARLSKQGIDSLDALEPVT